MDDEAIRILVTRLSRPHRSGGQVIERAAIVAASGADSATVLAWIAAHDGQPEPVAPVATRQGLHGGRLIESGPRRYVLPPGVLS